MLRPATLVDQPAPPYAPASSPGASFPESTSPDAAVHAPAESAGRVFLTAQWRNLTILNWQVAPELLASRVPPGVELDFHRGKTYVSMVGFQFLDARLLGLAIPFHRAFEEVNLRFYVLRRIGGEIRRGVVFVKEICPRLAVSGVARLVYNEHYVTRSMRHRVTIGTRDQILSAVGERLGEGEGCAEGQSIDVEFAWRHRRRWHRLSVRGHGVASPPPAGSLDEFIVEHYWAYTRQRDGGTIEYRVARRPWRVWPVRSARLSADVEAIYGRELAAVLRRPPDSAILADGSPVSVYRGTRIDL